MKKIILFIAALFFCNAPIFAQSKKCTVKATLGGKSGTCEMTTGELSSTVGIIVKNDFPDTLIYQVISYEFTCSSGDKTTSHKGIGNKLTPPMLQVMGTLQKNGKVYIDNVKVKFPNGTVKGVPGITVKVK